MGSINDDIDLLKSRVRGHYRRDPKTGKRVWVRGHHRSVDQMAPKKQGVVARRVAEFKYYADVVKKAVAEYGDSVRVSETPQPRGRKTTGFMLVWVKSGIPAKEVYDRLMAALSATERVIIRDGDRYSAGGVYEHECYFLTETNGGKIVTGDSQIIEPIDILVIQR